MTNYGFSSSYHYHPPSPNALNAFLMPFILGLQVGPNVEELDSMSELPSARIRSGENLHSALLSVSQFICLVTGTHLGPPSRGSSYSEVRLGYAWHLAKRALDQGVADSDIDAPGDQSFCPLNAHPV
ncbi:hypothetical protein K438DRAFT_1764107 [Mycena galopus ATCC 62051]|nr:hypothetical protein K438DRAFT_1764107 [Mycena galopus ATCC 62051]